MHMALVGMAVGAPVVVAGPALVLNAAPGEASARARLTGTSAVLCLLSAGSALGEGALNDWAGIFLLDDLHASFAVAGAASLIYRGARVVGRVAGDAVRLPMSMPRVAAGGGLPTAFGMGCGLAGLSPFIASAADALYSHHSSSAVASIVGFRHLGSLVGPPLIGVVAGHFGWRLALGTVVAAGAVNVAVAPALARPLSRVETIPQ